MLIVKQLAVLLVAVLSVGAASADWIEKSNDNALLVLRGQGAFEPETASAVGLEAFDAEVVDLRDDYVARENASDQALLGEMRRRLLAERDPRVRQDLEILIQSLGDAIETRRIYRQYMLPYFNLHGLLFGSFDALLDPRNDSERYPAALQRLRKYTGSEPGYTAIVELARARSRERFAVDGLQGPYRGELDKDLSDAPRYLAGIRAAFERAELSGWEEELPVLEAQLADYLEWLRREMLPRARPDHRLPAPVYADNLKNFGVRAAPRELIEQDDETDLLDAGQPTQIPVGRVGRVGVRGEGIADLVIDLDRRAEPALALLLGDFAGRWLQFAEPVVVNRVEHLRVHRRVPPQNGVRWRIAAESVPSSR